MSSSVYESRLRTIVVALRSLPSTNSTEQWQADLANHDADFWVDSISSATSEATKMILSGVEPPTVEEIRTMDAVRPGDQTPGVYLGLVADAIDENANFGYVGSGTRPGRGIGSRTAQHLNPEYRAKELEKQKHHLLFYHVLQASTRSVKFFCLMKKEWLSAQAADVTLTRSICVLAEQVYLIWFGTYAQSAAQGPQKPLARLSPFWSKNCGYLGTNFASPIRNNIVRAEGGEIALTPQDINRRKVEVARERRAEWIPEGRIASQEYHRSYHQRIANPIRRFQSKAKRQNMRKSEMDQKVREFRKATKRAHDGGEPPVDPASILIV